MKNVYQIYPIVTCKLGMPMAELTWRRNYDKWVVAPVYSFLIKGGSEPVLFDTGISYKEMAAEAAVVFGGVEGVPLEDSLEKLGVSTSDIRTIIISHIHPDHFLDAKKFPKAKLIVQDAELRFARNPHPLLSKQYTQRWQEGLTFEAVNGDTEIMPGIEVISTPGHSPGGHSVCVNTKQGKVVIVGACTADENFSGEDVIVPGIHSDIFKLYDSLVRLKEMSKNGYRIIPLHSQSLLSVESICRPI